MQWIPSEKKKPATELSMESFEEMVEELEGLVKDRGIAIAIKPTKIMFCPSDFENVAGSAKREWINLTYLEIDQIYCDSHDDDGRPLSIKKYERALEAKLREKNT